jgi:biotin-dependent carboxylase-like uncharacterized protein
MHKPIAQILKAGLFTSIQGSPSFELVEFGVPLTGPMDSYSAQKANKLVGNPLQSPLLELTLTGPQIKFLRDCKIALCGAHFECFLDEKPIYTNELIEIPKGSVLSFGTCIAGCRAYLAFEGGLLKSINTNFIPGQLIKGDLLLAAPVTTSSLEKIKSIPLEETVMDKNEIIVQAGPDIGLFDSELMQQLKKISFRVDAVSNRMAYVLQGADIDFFPDSFISSPTLPGTIQLTPSGQLNVLMRDCQTVGGYPRIGILDEVMMNCLAQKKQGDNVRLIWN